MDFALMFIGLAAAGVFIGICSGLLGIGGGTVMIPLLRLVFGLDAYMATATSLFTIIPTSISGAASHIRNKSCYPKLGIALGLGGSVTSALGVYLGNMSPAWAIILVAALIIFYSAYTMLSKALRLPRADGQSGKRRGLQARTGKASSTEDDPAAQAASDSGRGTSVSDACKSDAPESASDRTARIAGSVDDGFALSRKKLMQGFAIGMIAGLSAGYVGVGGGFVMVPLMTALLGVPMKKASGTSIVAIIILSIPGVIGQMMLGHVDYFAGIMLAVGSIPGAAIGARLIKAIDERQLRLLFAAFLLAAGVSLIGNEFAQLA